MTNVLTEIPDYLAIKGRDALFELADYLRKLILSQKLNFDITKSNCDLKFIAPEKWDEMGIIHLEFVDMKQNRYLLECNTDRGVLGTFRKL